MRSGRATGDCAVFADFSDYMANGRRPHCQPAAPARDVPLLALRAGNAPAVRQNITIDCEMLEHRMLLVRPRTASAVQTIVDGDSGAPLGFARWEAEESAWRRFFGRRLLAVHEHEDEPLLFTIRRAWSLLPRREVRDAEGQVIGSLLGRLVHDHFGRTIAARQGGLFLSPNQRPLAETTTTVDGLRVLFSAEIAGEPFIKMLLLAAVLQMTG